MTALRLCALLLIASACASITHAADAPKPCSDPEFRKFDYWVGDWDTFEIPLKPDAKSVARNHVDVILDGCVIREDYDQFDGHHGQSFTIYDAARKRWHQSWVTNRGELWMGEGFRRGNCITLEGDSLKDGKKQRVRVFWELQGNDVRETATVSDDAGKTWKPLFDILFRKHAP